MVLRPPQPWPPKAKVELFKQQQGDALVKLTADTAGRFGFEVASPDGIQHHLFQPVTVEGSGYVLLSIGWSSEGARLHINNDEIFPYQNDKSKAVVIKTSDDQSVKRSLVLPEIDPGIAGCEAEHLFLGTISDIDRMALDNSWYNIIRAAGLLWQLLIDNNALVHAVNKMYKQKLWFDIMNPPKILPFNPSFQWIDIDPSMFPGSKTIAVELDDFLNAPCFLADDVMFEVQDLIGACANARGGRHLGKTKGPRKAERQVVIDWDRAVRILGKEPSQVAVAGICRISLRGLCPLVEAIKEAAARKS